MAVLQNRTVAAGPAEGRGTGVHESAARRRLRAAQFVREVLIGGPLFALTHTLDVNRWTWWNFPFWFGVTAVLATVHLVTSSREGPRVPPARYRVLLREGRLPPDLTDIAEVDGFRRFLAGERRHWQPYRASAAVLGVVCVVVVTGAWLVGGSARLQAAWLVVGYLLLVAAAEVRDLRRLGRTERLLAQVPREPSPAS